MYLVLTEGAFRARVAKKPLSYMKQSQVTEVDDGLEAEPLVKLHLGLCAYA
jgi:hypothetical protein